MFLQTRPHDGRRRDGGKRAGQRLSLHGRGCRQEQIPKQSRIAQLVSRTMSAPGGSGRATAKEVVRYDPESTWAGMGRTDIDATTLASVT